jgi:nitrogen regulatory protein P-II 1
MKKLSIVIHSTQQQELADLLRSLQVDCFMFSHIEEHSSQDKDDVFLSARDRVVGYVPKIRLDVILENARAGTLLEEIRDSTFSCNGKNMYWITDLEKSGSL